jgi:RNA polymerase sigma factor (sigma-70 family)
LPADDRQAFVAALVTQHGKRLQRYLALRLRNAVVDVPDLMQEVYLRLLRMPRHETIRSPQAYLFTIAHHVLYEHRLGQSAVPDAVEMTDLLAESETYVDVDPASQLEARQRIEQFDQVLKEVAPRAYVTFVLHRRYGYSLEEIGEYLGVSRPMVKKYLAKAVAHCRLRFEEMK